MRVRLLWDTLSPDTDQWPPLYVLWRIHSKDGGRTIRHRTRCPRRALTCSSTRWRPDEELQLEAAQPPVHLVLPGGGSALGGHERGAQGHHALPGHPGEAARVATDPEVGVRTGPPVLVIHAELELRCLCFPDRQESLPRDAVPDAGGDGKRPRR